MKYYLHDTSAFDDEKVSELFIKFGYEGVGLFYVILEKLGKQEKPIKTEVLKRQLRVGKKLEKCWNFMESLEIISSNNGETFNKQLLNFSEKFMIKKEKTRIKVEQWRKDQIDTKIVTGYVPPCNPPKGNVMYSTVIKGTEEEEKTTPPEFGNLLILSEEKLKVEFKNSFTIIENCMKLYKLQEGQVLDYFDQFLAEQKIKENLNRTFKDIKEHFGSWLKIEIEKNKRTGQNQSKQAESKQEQNNRVARELILKIGNNE